MRAELTVVFDVALVEVNDGDVTIQRWKPTREDGPGPVPAAEAVLGRAGWRTVGDWRQTAGGISGGVWEADVEHVN